MTTMIRKGKRCKIIQFRWLLILCLELIFLLCDCAPSTTKLNNARRTKVFSQHQQELQDKKHDNRNDYYRQLQNINDFNVNKNSNNQGDDFLIGDGRLSNRINSVSGYNDSSGVGVIGSTLKESMQCTIECLNDSICMEGDADFHFHPHYINGAPLPFHVETNRNGYYCNCPLGLTGINCGRKFVTCGSSGHVCYHGGRCIEGLNSIHEEDTLFCDCADAKYALNHYIGKYCELPVPISIPNTTISNTTHLSSKNATTNNNLQQQLRNTDNKNKADSNDTTSIEKSPTKICDEEKSLFCMNNGICKNQDDISFDKPCFCNAQFAGPHCEFPIGKEPHTCDLDCKNGGSCRIGVQDYDDVQDYSNFWEQNLKNLTYCSCPTKWHGMTCEIPSHKINVCSNNGSSNSSSSSNNITDKQYFCVNDGICKDRYNAIRTDDKPCECLGDFDGPHCEFKAGEVPICDMQCKNDGQCKFGMKELAQDSTNYTKYWEDNVNFLYCDCPFGYHGLYCDISEKKITFCDLNNDGNTDDNGNNKYFCVNGGTCNDALADNSNSVDFCLCPKENTGIHCEFEKDEMPDCNLDCKHGGSCQVGIKQLSDYDKYWDSHVNFAYCNCPPNYHGTNCEIPSIPCGEDQKCFYGSTCVTPEDDAIGPYCDCSANGTIAALSENATAGDYCQYNVSSYCDLSFQSYFCVNGGTCNGVNQTGCDCPSGFSGSICQYDNRFKSNEQKSTEEKCELQCQNDGICQIDGSIKSAPKMILNDPELAFFNLPYDAKNTEICLCKDGYGGKTCEIKIEVCGINSFVCLHGSTCTKSAGFDDNEGYSCDCKDAWTKDSRFAGKFCQHHHTEVCAPSGDIQYFGSNFADSGFCVNDGSCKPHVYENLAHGGCNCPPQYTGPHCEFALSVEAQKEKENAEFFGKRTIIFYLFLVFTFIAVLFTLILQLRKLRQQQRLEGIHVACTNGRNNDGIDANDNSMRSLSSLSDCQGNLPYKDTSKLISNYGNIMRGGLEEVELL